MTYPLPTRSAGDAASLHVADHNEIHGILGLALPTGLTTGSSAHLNDHIKIHRILNTIQDQALPTDVTAASSGHTQHHNTIHALLNAETYGPRGTVGQTDPTTITSETEYGKTTVAWPGTFTSSHSTFASLSSAVSAAGTGRKFRITASMAFTSVIAPHASDELWFDDGVTITRSGSFPIAIDSSANNVKIINGVFDGFNAGTGSGHGNITDRAIKTTGEGWEVGYCEFRNTYFGTSFVGGTGVGSVAHHCIFDTTGSGASGPNSENNTWRDCEFYNTGDHGVDGGGDGGFKAIGTTAVTYAHNWSHSDDRSAIWFDTNCSSSLIEWNLIEDCTGTMGAVSWESNNWVEGTVILNPGGPMLGGTAIDDDTKNICRYNKFQNNTEGAVAALHSRWVHIYRNTCNNDSANNGNNGSIRLALVDLTKWLGPSGTGTSTPQDLINSSVHHNYVRQKNTSRRATSINLGPLVTDTDPYLVTNTKNNNFDYNTYELIATSTAGFAWPLGTNKTLTQWQAIPQGSAGTGATQDINGSVVA